MDDQTRPVKLLSALYLRHPVDFAVDAALYPRLARFKWRVNRDGYAYRSTSVRRSGCALPWGVRKFLHAEVLRVAGYDPTSSGVADVTIDHLNGNPRDCRIDNLEVVPRGENTRRAHLRRSAEVAA